MIIEQRLTQANELRETMTEYFNDMGLVDMLDESRKRWSIYTEPRAVGEWKSTFRSSNPRNQLLRLVANLTVKYLDPEFKFTGSESDKQKMQFVKDIFVATEQMHDGDIMQLLSALVLAIDGTAVRYLGYSYSEQSMKELDDYSADPDEVTYTRKKITRWHPVDMMVPIEEMYFANPYQRDVQKQPHLLQLTPMPLATFKETYARYRNVDKVRPIKNLLPHQQSFYQNYDNREDTVVVLSHYDKFNDNFDIIASGIPLTKPDNPIPFIGTGKNAGKIYPYPTGQFEPNPRTIYGTSLMFKLRGEDAIVSTLYRMIIDREFLALRAPLVVSGQTVSDVADWTIAPDQMFEVEGDGEIKTLDLQPADPRAFQLVDKLERLGEASGASTQNLGVTQNAPATNAAISEKNARELWGVLAKCFAIFNRDVNRIKLANIMTYAMNPITIVQTMGATGLQKYEETWGQFNLDNVKLSDGTVGTKAITIRSTPYELLSRSDLDMKEALAKKKGENVEYQEATPDYIRNLEVDLKLSPVDVTGESDNSEKILFSNLMDKAAAYFPDLMDRNEWYKKLLEMNDQNVDELTAKAGQQPMGMEGMPPTGAPQPNGAGIAPGAERAMVPTARIPAGLKAMAAV